MQLFSLFIPLLLVLPSLADKLVSRNFPHLIIPISKREPDKPHNTVKVFDVERDVWTLTSFDTPNVNKGWCSFGFTLNTTYPWTHTGSDPFRFNITTITRDLDKDNDTWNNKPEEKDWIATIEVYKSGWTSMWGGYFECEKDGLAQYLLRPATDEDAGVTWFELDEPLHGLTYDVWIPEQD